MPSFIKKMRRLFAMEWSKALAYRFDVAAWTLAEASIPLVSLAVWYAVAVNSLGGPSPQETLTYYLVVMFVKVATDAWNGFIIASEILNGDIVKYLVKPFSMFWHSLAENVTEKSFKLAIPLPLFIGALFLFPETFTKQIYELDNWLLFIPSIFLAMILSFTMENIFGLLAFWLEEAHQLRAYKYILETIASGILIPFALMPPLVATAFSFLPFRYIISVPAEILLGQISTVHAIQLLGFQLLWITIVAIMVRLLWSQGLKRYAVPGQ